MTVFINAFEDVKKVINNIQLPEVAVLASGGADSTLLLWLMSKANLNIRTFTVDRYNGPIPFAFDSIRRLNALGCNIPEPIILEKRTEENLDRISYALTDITTIYKLFPVFTGTTQPPPIETGISQIRPHNQTTYMSTNGKEAMPFINLTKAHVIEFYYYEGIEELLPHTHSCGHKTGGGACGECFNCRERLWAFEQIGRPPVMGV